MVWFYEAPLDPGTMLSALRKVLAAYPVLCGRYASPPWTAIDLNNAGVPVHICTLAEGSLAEAIAHLPPASLSESPAPTFFSRGVHEAFVPSKAGMDPDGCSPEAPLMSIKISLFPQGGTAIGLLAQHAVVDADAIICFMRNWSLAFRGLPLDPPPVHERALIEQLSLGDLPLDEKPGAFKVTATLPATPPSPPPFAGVMPRIAGPTACVVPMPKAALLALKASAGSAELLPAGAFVSTDDLVAARVWQSLCAVRIAQLGLPADSDERTTISRASNFRSRTEPPLGAGYCANGVSQVWTEATVAELLSATTTAVALWLRTSLRAHSSTIVAARAAWLRRQLQAGCRVAQEIDAKALTFIVSSWGFDWQAANFGAEPVCFDQGCNVPIVSVMAPRPHGDGLHVYATGPRASLEQFARLMQAAGGENSALVTPPQSCAVAPDP